MISGGTAHRIPQDLKEAFLGKARALEAWEDITPLARNEWICWIESVKKEETRRHHIKRALAELAEGKRRPCCWIGCTHRDDKAMSASQKWALKRKKKF